MTTTTRLTQPVAKPQRTETTPHGRTLIDDYAWLRDKESAETLAYLQAENDYTAAALESTTGLQETLYREMLSHIKETDVSVPFRDGDYWYYTRTEEGLQYPIYCRRRGSPEPLDPDAPESVILDVNKLAEGESFMAIGGMTVSDDSNLLAYSVDNKGFRQYTLQVKDLRTGAVLSERVERTGSIVWAVDNKTLFYTVEDEEQKRQYQLFRHVLGAPHAEDVLVYEETDERFNIGAGRTRDDKYIILESASHTTSEARFLPADTPDGEFRLIAERRDNIEYYVEHRNELFFIRANDTGRNFRLVTAPVATPGIENWTELIAHRAEVMLEEVDLFSGFYVACERRDGLQHLRVLRFSGDGTETPTSQEIAFPEPVYSAYPHQNRIFDTTRYRYAYQSLVTPSSVYEYDIATGESKLLK